MKYPCDYCENNKQQKGGKVDCAQFGLTAKPEHCAALILTVAGWEFCAKEVAAKGDVKTANLYYERAIELQIPEIKTVC